MVDAGIFFREKDTRRIGGLEKRLLVLLRNAIDTRRIGGLETRCQVFPRCSWDTRRIGGLEMAGID